MPIRISSERGSGIRLWAYEATGNYFDLLGVQPLLGRLFHPEDDESPGAHPVLVLSYRCWHTRFGSDPDIAGKTVKINDLTYSIWA